MIEIYDFKVVRTGEGESVAMFVEFPGSCGVLGLEGGIPEVFVASAGGVGGGLVIAVVEGNPENVLDMVGFALD